MSIEFAIMNNEFPNNELMFNIMSKVEQRVYYNEQEYFQEVQYIYYDENEFNIMNNLFALMNDKFVIINNGV